MKIPKYYDYEYYVGDPCYVIDDERWNLFCDRLWAAEHRERIIQSNCSDKEPEEISYDDLFPLFVDWETKQGVTFSIEVWNSPNGDGEWHFSPHTQKKHGWIAGESMPVDAGILAIVPKDAIENTSMMLDNEDIKSLRELGILFNREPILQTSHHIVGYVQLNDEEEDFVIYCDNCGNYLESEYDIIYSDCGCSQGCYSCFEECEDCYEEEE